MVVTPEIDNIIGSIRRDLALATDVLMTVAEGGLSDVAVARTGDERSLTRIESKFLGVLEACALEDLIGQRLTQLEVLMAGASAQAPKSGQEGLLNGPAHAGEGLNQGGADKLLAIKP